MVTCIDFAIQINFNIKVVSAALPWFEPRVTMLFWQGMHSSSSLGGGGGGGVVTEFWIKN